MVQPPTRCSSNSIASTAPTERSSPRPQDSAPGGLPEGPVGGSKFWPILPKALALCRVESLAVAQSLIDRYPAFFFFSSEYPMCYMPFANDFGPVNLAVVHAFYLHMHKYCALPELATRQIVYYVPDSEVAITNASFLLASYLVIELGYTPEEAWAPFQAIPDIRAFRDVTEGTSDYELTVLACLQGLSKGLSLGWYDPTTFDAEEYTFLNSTSSLDMSLISPKFCAFRGPRGSKVEEVHPGVFTCPPSQYIEPFKRHNVSTVVRLNEATTYQKSDFIKEGLDHRDLYFDDCTTPSKDIIDKFLHVAEAAPGVVAVHCKAGLGRTGTLIAIHMMKHQGLTASECIGWLRIVRPGSIIGTQQHFLHWAEGRYRRVDKVLRTGSLKRCQRVDTKPHQPRPKSAEEPAPAITKTPSELGEEIAKAQMRRDQILAKASTQRDAHPLNVPARRTTNPKTPIDAAVPLTPEHRHVKAPPRPILRKRGSLPELSDRGTLSAAHSPAPTPLPLAEASSGMSSADSKASTDDGRAPRTSFPSISVGTFLRRVSRPFGGSSAYPPSMDG